MLIRLDRSIHCCIIFIVVQLDSLRVNQTVDSTTFTVGQFMLRLKWSGTSPWEHVWSVGCWGGGGVGGQGGLHPSTLICYKMYLFCACFLMSLWSFENKLYALMNIFTIIVYERNYHQVRKHTQNIGCTYTSGWALARRKLIWEWFDSLHRQYTQTLYNSSNAQAVMKTRYKYKISWW